MKSGSMITLRLIGPRGIQSSLATDTTPKGIALAIQFVGDCLQDKQSIGGTLERSNYIEISAVGGVHSFSNFTPSES